MFLRAKTVDCETYIQILIVQKFEINFLCGWTFTMASPNMVELCVPGVPFNWLRTSRHAPENAIFVEFEQCLAWAFIDLPLQARNAPICAPGKKRETLSFSLPLHAPFSQKPRQKGHPREIRRRVVWFMTEVSRRRSPLPNFVKLLLALFSIPSRLHILAFLFLRALTKFKPCLFFSPLTLRSIVL